MAACIDFYTGSYSLALAGYLGYLFWPYLPTLAWAQLVAFSLRGLRDRFKRKSRRGIFYKRGAELSDSQAAAVDDLRCFGAPCCSAYCSPWAWRVMRCGRRGRRHRPSRPPRSRGVPDWAKAPRGPG